MKKNRNLSAIIIAGLLLPGATLWAEVICKARPPLKPVRCICGRLVDQSGAPVPGATVKVIKDGADLAAVETANDGKFVFGELKSGRYELNAQASGLEVFRAPIVLASPAKKCKRELAIVLVPTYPDNCGSYVMKR